MNQPAKYINPFTDFGFKRLFGEEPSKDLLKDFLNELLREEQGTIIDLQYLNNEQLGNTELDRKAIFDIYCTNQQGEKFIVELQKAKQNYFKDRSVFYSTFPIQEQAQKGNEWNFQLKAVYTIGILDFVFDEDKHKDNYLNKYRYDIKLTEQETKDVFYDKLTFIYLAMPKFNKSIDEINTHFDKWLYIFKNLSQMQAIPANLQEDIFIKFFSTAEIAQLNRDDMRRYENSLKYYRDMKNSLDTSHEEGIEKGREEGIAIGKEIGIEEGKEIGKEIGREEGKEIGREEGKEIGRKEGKEIGREEGKEIGREEGKEIGREEGEKLKQLEIAKNLKQAGLTIELIAQNTGLNIQQVKDL